MHLSRESASNPALKPNHPSEETMNIRRSLTLTLATLGMLAGEATGQHVVPGALLTIDQIERR